MDSSLNKTKQVWNKEISQQFFFFFCSFPADASYLHKLLLKLIQFQTSQFIFTKGCLLWLISIQFQQVMLHP